MATITIRNIFFLSQGSSHNNIVKLQSDNIRDKKIIFLVLDHLNAKIAEVAFLQGRSIISWLEQHEKPKFLVGIERSR